MQEYFKLQCLMVNRKVSDFGVHPIIGYLLIALAFVGFSALLFYKIALAPYAYVIVTLLFTSKLSESGRNDFLKICFGAERYRTVRVLENLTVIFPFLAFLIYKQQLYPAVILAAAATLIALLSFKTAYNITIPTPFYRRPFEFTVGFRNTFFLFLLAYGLSVIAVVVDNFNLGVFALLLIFFTIFCYYLKPENEYFVWSYSLSPARFLIEKIRTAALFSFYLCAPILLVLSISYVENIGILLLFAILGCLYLAAVILAKYAAYPGEISLAQAAVLGLCLAFPPLLVAVIPFFAHQSAGKLKEFLR